MVGKLLSVNEIGSMCDPVASLQDLITHYEILEDPLDLSTLRTNLGFAAIPPEFQDKKWSEIPIHPCGLQAVSILNDMIVKAVDADDKSLPLSNASDDISYINEYGLQKAYKNPSEELMVSELGKNTYFWMNLEHFPDGIESPDFMNWMTLEVNNRVSNLKAVIKEPVKLPLKLSLENRYSVSAFRGIKMIELRQTKVTNL